MIGYRPVSLYSSLTLFRVHKLILLSRTFRGQFVFGFDDDDDDNDNDDDEEEEEEKEEEEEEEEEETCEQHRKSSKYPHLPRSSPTSVPEAASCTSASASHSDPSLSHHH